MESFLSSAGAWKTTPRWRRTSGFRRSTSPIRAVPEVGAREVERILKRVDFPLPLGPRRPKVSPEAASNETPSSATRSP
jgi:hypothetical protein